jgi:hypothetical protein
VPVAAKTALVIATASTAPNRCIMPTSDYRMTSLILLSSSPAVPASIERRFPDSGLAIQPSPGFSGGSIRKPQP